jgi:Uma2 family endonuclease
MATVEPDAALLTAEEFANRPETDMAEELVRGVVVMSPPPGFRHGVVCNTLGRLLGDFAADRELGYVLSNDAGVVTRRGPDSVRGPDISYYSYASVPKGGPPVGYAATPPELVCEVLSPGDRWREALEKAAEYLGAGVSLVVIVDPERRTVHIFETERAPRELGPDDAMRLEPVLPGFEVVVGRLFG